MNKLKLISAMPGLLKASAYILLGVGAGANAFGYTEVGNVLLGIASIFGLKDVANGASTQ